MVRPYYMDSGRVSPAGVPEALGEGRWKATRRDRLRFAKKEAERRDMREWLQKYLKKGQLSPMQKKIGARKVA